MYSCNTWHAHCKQRASGLIPHAYATSSSKTLCRQPLVSPSMPTTPSPVAHGKPTTSSFASESLSTRPCTLNPRPCTLNPRPYTLNQPCALNPEPSDLRSNEEMRGSDSRASSPTAWRVDGENRYPVYPGYEDFDPLAGPNSRQVCMRVCLRILDMCVQMISVCRHTHMSQLPPGILCPSTLLDPLRPLSVSTARLRAFSGMLHSVKQASCVSGMLSGMLPHMLSGLL